MIEAEAQSEREPAPPHLSLAALFAQFFARGLQAFGGPVAQIAALRRDLVDREKWTDEARFLRTLAVYQVLPGPEATEMCCWFGHLARGRLGALAAGLGFVLPGFLCVLLCAWAYAEHGLSNPTVAAAMSGVQPAVVALVVLAVRRLSRGVLARAGAGDAVAVGFLGDLVGLPFSVPLAAGAMFAAFRPWVWSLRAVAVLALVAVAFVGHPELPWAPVQPTTMAANGGNSAAVAGATSAWSLLGSGLEAGLLTFGGAYTAIPFVRADLVGDGGAIGDAQFLDALAVAGVLPAPLVMFTTFVGYLAGGFLGALAITIGVFAPAFSFSWIGHAVIERLANAKQLHAALEGVAAAVAGLVAATALRLCFLRLVDLRSALLFAVALALLLGLRTRFAPLVVVTACAVLGIASA